MSDWLRCQCLSSPHSRFAAAVIRHLDRKEEKNLYSSSVAFESFINGGGNVPLYEHAVHTAFDCLKQERFGKKLSLLVWAENGFDSVLRNVSKDLGCGTGKLFLPLLSKMSHVQHLHVVLVDSEEAMMNGLRDKVTVNTMFYFQTKRLILFVDINFAS
jgi:hypothetical protein